MILNLEVIKQYFPIKIYFKLVKIFNENSRFVIPVTETVPNATKGATLHKYNKRSLSYSS